MRICQFLENGYVEEEEFIAVINSFQELALKNNHSGSFTEAWRLFHDTFSENERVLVGTLRERFLDGAKWISLGNAMGTVKLMRELKREDVADELVSHWIDMAKKENKELLNLEKAHLFEGSFDEKFRDAVKDAYLKDMSLPTLSETLKSMVGKNGWGMDQVEVLSRSSTDDYYQFFKSIDSDEHLSSYVKTCLQFGGSNDGEERFKRIYAASSEALRKIAGESHLNTIRISRYLPDVVA